MTEQTEQAISIAPTRSELRDAKWYEDRGLVRYTIVITNRYKELLHSLAKKYHVSQNGVIEVFLDTMDEEALAPKFIAKSVTSPGKGRPIKNATKASVGKLIKEFSPEQLATVQAMLQQMKAAGTEPV